MTITLLSGVMRCVHTSHILDSMGTTDGRLVVRVRVVTRVVAVV